MKVLSVPEVIERTSLSRSTLRRLELAGKFPRRLRLGSLRCGWIEEEVEAWIASRNRGMVAAGH